MINSSTLLRSLFLFYLLFIILEKGTTQQLFAGDWYSSDSSRIYHITEVSRGNFEVRLLSSDRPADSIGALVISSLTYQPNRKKLRGIIHSLNTPLTTGVTLAADSGDRLNLRLNRLYIFPVHLYWVRRL